jgi:hypothetical protein
MARGMHAESAGRNRASCPQLVARSWFFTTSGRFFLSYGLHKRIV